MRILFYLSVLLLSAFPATAETPRIVVSAAPLHGVVSAVTAGTSETPELLLSPAVSPHGYQLKPSDRMKLERADIVFWGGKNIEGFLFTALKAMPDKKNVAFMNDIPVTLTARRGGLWSQENSEEIDPHFWLSPENMKHVALTTARVLGETDTKNAVRYQKNADAFIKRLDTWTYETRARLAPLKNRPYLVFHDAYHYFENTFGLAPFGSVTPDAHHAALSAKRIAVLRRAIAEHAPVCLFTEPQQSQASVAVITENLDVRTGVLDPLGTTVAAGENFYINLMRDLTDHLAGCLSALPDMKNE